MGFVVMQPPPRPGDFTLTMKIDKKGKARITLKLTEDAQKQVFKEDGHLKKNYELRIGDHEHRGRVALVPSKTGVTFKVYRGGTISATWVAAPPLKTNADWVTTNVDLKSATDGGAMLQMPKDLCIR